ncbi:hypothetical protein R5R35_000898 [Gryllus longicercus]|uniref:Cytochrome b5 n=1 Tax=Gryllus longicercus TaxID=2509291 RepID=A0AAN9VWT0_9ORTH
MATEMKFFTREEVKSKKNSNNAWIIIHNSIYNVTDFLNEHPGGEEVLLEQAGKDGTEAFEDVGHSANAKEIMKKYKIGEVVESQKMSSNATSDTNGNESFWKSWIIPIALSVVMTIIYRFYVSTQGH